MIFQFDRFHPKEDIISIVKDRLKEVEMTTEKGVIIEERALSLCATKVASSNGDIRKVLDICRFVALKNFRLSKYFKYLKLLGELLS